MKKRIIGILLCATMGLSLAACGSSSDTSSDSSSSAVAESTADASEDTESVSEDVSDSAEEVELEYDYPILEDEDYTLEDCFTLGEYKGLELTRTVEPVTDGAILLRVSQQTGETGEEVTDEDAEVQEGDTVNLDYEGKLDGVAFDGGTGTDYDLQIGSDTFIDGFEDGMIGMKVGETKDLNLTFPESYGSAELAGQDVVFTVTVNSITRLDITDEWVEENAGSDFSSAEEYLDSFREVLEEENEENADATLKSDAWYAVQDNSTFIALPKDMLEEAEEAYEEMYGDEAEYFIQYYGEDAYYEIKKNYIQSDVMGDLMLQALMEAEDIEADSDEYNEELEELVESIGAESADELMESYGEETIREYILQDMAVDKILSYAEVTEA